MKWLSNLWYKIRNAILQNKLERERLAQARWQAQFVQRQMSMYHSKVPEGVTWDGSLAAVQTATQAIVIDDSGDVHVDETKLGEQNSSNSTIS